ncbi:lantibiotic dehydratase [Pedobacter chinensis]|nr:lantibiotic dehydratase [Pedobacter chinensis]
MKPNIHPSVIFRTPKFSYQSDLSACWDELKQAIAISSGAFYETIKDVEADDLKNLPQKVYFTIWKYFNRAKYRSTPYGTFASFSFLENAIRPDESRIVIDEGQIVHRFIDWPYRNELHFDFAEIILQNGLLFSNSSYYLTTDSIRYIACTNGVFELAEIEQDDFVKQILDTCIEPIHVNDLVEKLALDEESRINLLSLLNDMHSLQLVFTDRDPNIIGQDYFERVGITTVVDKPQYLIAERKAINGVLNEKLLRQIPNLIESLSKILQSDERDALKNFITRFKRKFDQQEVPLLTALDPEMGVGYDELEQAGENDDFVAQFNHKKNVDKDEKDLKYVLKNHLSKETFNKREPIFLNKLSFGLNEKPGVLPNSFSLLMSLADDLVCIDQIGGATANALTGRFSIADAAVEEYCKNTSNIEQKANPDVLFFDVAYMVETNVDNINRRKLVYGHQLSILNFDTSASPLALHDIQISVKDNQVFLRSYKLNKRLVPRLASAYNYTRSDLSVFRLLCDLQHQGIQTSLSFTLENIFPDLDYYPRFQYHNVVLSTAKWRVNKEMFFPDKVSLSIEEARSYLKKTGLSKFFKAGLSDQTLCFNLDNDDDVSAFLQFMQKQKKVYLEEVIITRDSVVEDQNGKPYLAQFILNLHHNNTVYGKLNEEENADTSIQQVYLPGKEWLYFEIYCHQQRSDEILAGIIPAFLGQFSEEIKSWFFIRYNENGNHLRFRVLLNKQEDGQKLTSAFSDALHHYLDKGLVSDLQLKTYKRETERYGANLISQVEQHFSVDSEFVLSLLQNHADAFTKYKSCSTMVNELRLAGVFDGAVLTKIIKLVSDSFNEEHHLDASDFKKLNQQYQLYKNLPEFTPHQNQKNAFDEFKKSFINILNQSSGDKRVKLFTDLMHMHVNRLFSRDQRTNEMVMYYFLLKDIQRKNAIG